MWYVEKVDRDMGGDLASWNFVSPELGNNVPQVAILARRRPPLYRNRTF